MHDANPPMGHAGHDHHAMMIEDFRKRFYVVLVLTVPTMLLSEMIQHWLGIHISFPGSKYVLLLLSSVIFFYGGMPFLKGWINEMKAKNPRMMTLIGFPITVAYIYSVATVFGLTLLGVIWVTRTFIPYFRERGKGLFIHLSSTISLNFIPGKMIRQRESCAGYRPAQLKFISFSSA
ncbi:hypothetical protein [Chitinophaga silvisoli]|uniref:hypothetical protein n=1 Tax=Chitinophaga silvisoli TaxID=2291814 RepID=UPI0018F2182D|nr:hypothetical protein [Chitinophaga silvisoli]